MAYVIKVNHADSLRRLTYEKQPGGNDGLSFADLEAKIREMFKLPTSAKLKVTYVDSEKDVITMENDQDLKDACVFQSLNPLRLNVVLASPGSKSPGGPSRMPSFNAAFEGLDESLKEILKNLRPENVKTMFQAYEPLYKDLNLRPENVKNMFQAFEPLFKDVKHPSQIPDLLENIVKTAASQFASFSGNRDTSASTPATNQNETAPQDGTAQAQNEEKNPSGCVHYGVSCDVCGTTPILGNRYKCLIKDNYDLCSSCYSKAGASAGEYEVIDKSPFRPRHCRYPRGRMMCPAMGPVGHMPRYPHWGMRAPQDGQGGRLDARFVRDVSIFDGTELAPGTRFTKIWRLRNSGTAAWPASTKLVNIDGDDLRSAIITPLEIGEHGLAPEEEIEVSVDCVAPLKSGRYQSTWRLATPWGPKFGHKIWVQIQVVPSDTLNQPAQVHIDGGNEDAAQGGETSTAVPVEFLKSDTSPLQQVTQLEKPSPPASTSVPVEVLKGDTLPDNVQVTQVGKIPSPTATAAHVEVVKSDNSPQANEATTGSETMRTLEESFVKVDVNNIGDEAPLIQMIEMLSGSTEDEKTETQSTPHSDAQETDRADEVVGNPVEDNTTEVPSAPVESVEAKAPGDTDEEEASSFKPLLMKLEAMGFNDRALNLELLKANALDLRKTVDALCDVDDWAPALAELEDMGFNDMDVNRRLMFKNRGNLKRVVKELVQLAKEVSGRAQ